MHHRVRNFNAGGKTVEDESAGFLLKDADELPVGGEVVFIAEDGGGEVAVEGLGDEFQIDLVRSYHKGVRTKNLLRKTLLSLSAKGLVQKRLAIRGK